jgi:hypothetical protein
VGAVGARLVEEKGRLRSPCELTLFFACVKFADARQLLREKITFVSQGVASTGGNTTNRVLRSAVGDNFASVDPEVGQPGDITF